MTMQLGGMVNVICMEWHVMQPTTWHGLPQALYSRPSPPRLPTDLSLPPATRMPCPASITDQETNTTSEEREVAALEGQWTKWTM